MTGPAPVLSAIQTRLLTVLEPLLVAHGGQLNKIVVAPFVTVDDLRAVIALHKDVAPPFGVLSMGGFGATSSNEAKAANLAAQARINWSYAFAMVFGDLRNFEERAEIVYKAAEGWLSTAADRDLGKEEATPNWTLHRIDLATSNVFVDQDAQLYGLIFNFTVKATRRILPAY